MLHYHLTEFAKDLLYNEIREVRSFPSLSANKGVNQQLMRFAPFITPKNQNLPPTSGFSWSSTSLNATADRWRPPTLTTRCATTRCICSSTKTSLTNNASWHSSTAPTTPTLSLPSNRQEAAEVATTSVRTSQARNSPNPRKTSSNTAPPAPTLLTPSISVARIFLYMI